VEVPLTLPGWRSSLRRSRNRTPEVWAELRCTRFNGKPEEADARVNVVRLNVPLDPAGLAADLRVLHRHDAGNQLRADAT